MAQRFGGKYSPEGSPNNAPAPSAGGFPNPFKRSKPAVSTIRANLLFVLALPLVVRAFLMDASGLVMTVAGLAAILLSAWLTRDGVIAHGEWEARKVARRPAIPRKIFGAVLMGVGVALACIPDTGVPGASALGVLAAALHLVAFGLDPLRDKGMEGVDTASQDRANRAVAQAEQYLKGMSDAILRAGDRSLERRVEQFQATARRMFRTVEEDPRDLASARKYLTVYLIGARDAAVKFADLYGRGNDQQAKADFESLLADLETGFSRQTEALLTDNRDDLDVEISVLRERLEREGIRSE